LTDGRPEAPSLIVVGVDLLGAEVVRLVLGHGEDPVSLLAAHGWRVERARDVMSQRGARHVLTMSFHVREDAMSAFHPPALGEGLHRDEDLAASEDEVAEPHQRVAAYALVTSSRGVLMTQFSDRTNAQGQWGLPGGGIEANEGPERAVLREVWEESGQVVQVGQLALVHTSHWVGRAPSGRLEDFHAVRLVYRAACLTPTEPVVHDVGGTTASAAWVPSSDLDLLEVAASWRSLISRVIMAPDEADGAEHHEQPTDGDDRTGSQP
jgi:8-oxo-dGTP diphosphatase